MGGRTTCVLGLHISESASRQPPILPTTTTTTTATSDSATTVVYPATARLQSRGSTEATARDATTTATVDPKADSNATATADVNPATAVSTNATAEISTASGRRNGIILPSDFFLLP